MPNKPSIEEVKPGDVFYTPESPQRYEAVEVIVESTDGYNSLMYVPVLDGFTLPTLSSDRNRDHDEALERLNDSSAVYLGNLGDSLSELFQTLLEVGRAR